MTEKEEKIKANLSQWLKTFLDKNHKNNIEFQLKQELKKNKKFGSRDRKIIYTLFYEHFRNIGFENNSINENKFFPYSIKEKLSTVIDIKTYSKNLLKRPLVFFRILDVKFIPEIEGVIQINKITYGKNTFYFLDEENKSLNPFIENGTIEIQDLASQAIGLSMSLKNNTSLWDACCGAGGKSLQLSKINSSISILASDIRDYKFDDFEKRLKRSRISNIQIEKIDCITEQIDNVFDHILIDAPCSCSGVWGRNPILKWESNDENLLEINEAQRTILDKIKHNVNFGGIITYATCSVFTNENENQVESFLKANPDFEISPIELEIPHFKTDFGLYVNGFECHSDFTFICNLKRIK